MRDEIDPTDPVDPNAQDPGSEGGQRAADDKAFAEHASAPAEEFSQEPTRASAPAPGDAGGGADEAAVAAERQAVGASESSSEISQEELEMLQKAAAELQSVAESAGLSSDVGGEDAGPGEPGESSEGDWSAAWAEAGIESPAEAVDASEPTLPEFDDVPADVDPKRVSMLNDVKLRVKIELGRSRMLVEDVLKLGEGSVVELDKLAGDPVDVYVNDRLVARGEVLVLNDNFCVRVSDVISNDPHRVSV